MTRLHFLLSVMCFQWAFTKLALGFGDNGCQCNSKSPNSGLYFFQVCSSKAYFACQDHRWKSMILRTHLREVRRRQKALYSPFSCHKYLNRVNPFFNSSNVTTESTHIFLIRRRSLDWWPEWAWYQLSGGGAEAVLQRTGEPALPEGALPGLHLHHQWVTHSSKYSKLSQSWVDWSNTKERTHLAVS